MTTDEKEVRNKFISRIINEETVITLLQHGVVASSMSNNDEQRIIALFWSDRESAEEIRKSKNQDCELVAISLFEFLFAWLPDMFNSGILLGINWGGQEIGFKFDPSELQEQLVEAMPQRMLDLYTKKRSDNPQYSYVYFATYSNANARILLREFEKKGIQYDAGADASQIKGMNIVQAFQGGSCGQSSGIIITVHEDSLEGADAIQQQVFKLAI